MLQVVPEFYNTPSAVWSTQLWIGTGRLADRAALDLGHESLTHMNPLGVRLGSKVGMIVIYRSRLLRIESCLAQSGLSFRVPRVTISSLIDSRLTTINRC